MFSPQVRHVEKGKMTKNGAKNGVKNGAKNGATGIGKDKIWGCEL